MKNFLSSLFTIILLTSIGGNTFAQQKRFLQLDVNAGLSLPMQGFKTDQMFAGQGRAAGGGFDYFFGRFGFGFNAGYFANPADKEFAKYIEHKYLEKITLNNASSWNNIYGMLGPIYKIGYKNLELDIFARGGYSQIDVPTLLYTKTFFNQTYDVYKFSGATQDWQFAWSAGTRLMYKFNKWLGIQAKADYFSTNYLSNVSYDNTFRDATDGNRNGVIEDGEYFESQKITNKGLTPITVLNVNMGVVFQIGRSKVQKATQMMPEQIETIVEQTPAPVVKEEVEPVVKVEVEQSLIEEPVVKKIPVVNEKEAPKTDLVVTEAPTKTEVALEVIEIPATTYDAPEAKYDAEAAEFLYKAGESYFAINDFENATPCFNKLKADEKYPRAKYMFALSLCAMGNCEEARKEYREFYKTYTGDDKRTLEIIFASHIERCKRSGKLVPNQPNNNDVAANNSKMDNASTGKTYKIQFIAMKKPNANFPGVASVGNIETEFFPNKSVFRYALGGYNDLKSATNDVYKVRKMGFRDAFIAVYENGVRINTLYHAK